MGVALPGTLVFKHQMTARRHQIPQELDKLGFESGLARIELLALRRFDQRVDAPLEPWHHAAAATADNSDHQWSPRQLAVGIAQAQRKPEPSGTLPNLMQFTKYDLEDTPAGSMQLATAEPP